MNKNYMNNIFFQGRKKIIKKSVTNSDGFLPKRKLARNIFVFIFILTVLLISGCELFTNLFDNANKDTTPPAEVTTMNAISGTNDVTLTWTNPTDEDFDHVEICYGKTSIDTDFTGTATPSGTKISSLSSGTEYSFQIKTVDTNGNKSSGKTTTAKTKSTYLSEGAIKIVNSWGEGGWENKADGHYWVTYDSLLSLKPIIYFYENNFDTPYEPRMLAVFQVEHSYRDQALIEIGVGEPSNPVAIKRFQSDWGGTAWGEPLCGSGPFKDSDENLITMVMDISELIPDIHGADPENNVFLRIHNTGTTSGSVNSFSVEYYSKYPETCIKTINGGTGAFGSGDTTFSVTTKDVLTVTEEAQITPLPRASLLSEPVFVMEKPSAEELAKDMERYGVYEEGKNYNVVTPLGFGTGLAPMSEEGWNSMQKLKSVELPRNLTTSAESVDLSTTKWFPPIGNQGAEGACVGFSVGYYIHTYTEAREHNWDLSEATWEGGYFGNPSVAYQDKIMSPDFFYHQANSGVDEGSDTRTVMDIAVRIGGASWEAMPYDTDDHSSWPKEAAFREAAARRGRTIDVFSSSNIEYAPSYFSMGFFTIDSNESIDLLKNILAAGYCVSTSVRAGNNYGDLYYLLDSNDVVSGYSGGTMVTNHANTIVGYKEGSSWDPSNPDS